MKLENNNISIEVCDIYDASKDTVNRVAQGVCVACTRHYCKTCRISDYDTERWFPYPLRSNRFSFCKDCFKKVQLLSAKEVAELTGTSGTWAEDTFNKYISAEHDNAVDGAVNRISEVITTLIGTADERYKLKIEQDAKQKALERKKSEIQNEIDKLTNQKNSL